VLANGLANPVSFALLWRVALCFALIVSLWWIYFDWKYDPVSLKKTTSTFIFNYGHFLIYLGMALFSAGISTTLASVALAEQMYYGFLLLACGGVLFLLALFGISGLSGS
jgi:low temperature requirement protein LtrA